MTFKAAAKSQAPRLIRRSSIGLLAVGLIVLLAGCGSSSSSSSSSAAAETPPAETSSTASTPASTTPAQSTSASGESLKLEADPEGQLKYNTKALSAKAGKVTIDFTNSSPVGHNVTLESSSGQKVGETPTFQGGSKSLTATLKPGTYKFYCSVPGHRMAGMEGTLTVK